MAARYLAASAILGVNWSAHKLTAPPVDLVQAGSRDVVVGSRASILLTSPRNRHQVLGRLLTTAWRHGQVISAKSGNGTPLLLRIKGT